MDISNFNSSKPKRSRISMFFDDDNDGSIHTQLERLKEENSMLKVELMSKDAIIDKQAVLINESESNVQGIAENYRKIMEDLLIDVEANKEYKKRIKELDEQLRALKAEIEKRYKEMKQKEDEAHTVIADQQKKIFDLEDQLKQAKEANITPEDAWIIESRAAYNEVFNEEAKELLGEKGNEYLKTLDEILKKFEEKKYKSPKEFLLPLTWCIRSCAYGYGRKTPAHQSLDSLIKSLNDKFKPIIEKFIQMKEEQIISDVVAAFNAPA